MVSIVEKLSETALLIVPGDSLVTNNVASFKGELEELSQRTIRLVVDLSQVQFIDSAGCGALLQYHKRLKEKGGGLAVCCISAPVRALFELVRIQRALDIYPSRDAAVRALQA
ncbi:MAG: STAS domain-containing protein [Planctomycetes bacterium]|nr:STAS domain-containing protein [Planctomycetota bacterium]